MLTTEQLARRKLGIGGSDCAAILGVSEYKTPYQVWLDKTNQDATDLSEENETMQRGNDLEPLLKVMFEDVSNRTVKTPKNTIEHKKYPFMIANVDGYMPDEKAIIEFKTCSFRRKSEFGDSFTDEVPNDYLCQVHHYLFVTGMNVAFIGVLFSDDKFGFAIMQSLVKKYGATEAYEHIKNTEFDFRIFMVKRNQEFEAVMLRKCQHFWEENVLKNIPPELTNDKDVRLFVSKNLNEDKRVIADNDDMVIRELISQDDLKIKELEEHKASLKLQLQKKMGDAKELLTSEGKKLASWVVFERKSVDSKLLKETSPLVYQSFLKVTTVRNFSL